MGSRLVVPCARAGALSLLKLCLSMCAALLAACSPPAAPPADKMTVGEPLPGMVLTTLDGATSNLGDYRGRLVVLNFWATWCEPCRLEMPHLQQLSDALDPERFAVIGVAVDHDDHLVREFLLDKGVSFSRYIDRGQRLATAELGIHIFPYTLIIAPDGRLIQRYPGAREWQRPEVVELLERAYGGDLAGLR